MAAVAAEAGAVVPTTARSENPPEPGLDSTGRHQVPAEPSCAPESGSSGNPENGEFAEGRHVGPEQKPGAGPDLPGTDRTSEGQLDRSGTSDDVPDRSSVPPNQAPSLELSELPVDCSGSERVFLGLPNSDGTSSYRTIPLDPQPPAVFLHSVPDPAPVSEAGLSLAEPAEPTETTELDRCYTILDQELGSRPKQESGSEGVPEPAAKFCKTSAGSKHEDCSGSVPSSVLDLSPGTEVRVSLEHVIDDALVVSFRLGEQVFSGVLMDVSKRFGPYGIPITTFPRRDDRSCPPAPLQTIAVDDKPTTNQEEASAVSVAPSHPQPWGSKPPPLFQEGAPYPPPLFIRDTYNLALPQPPPRKIKRPKRRYRCEEPTSIMNSIKLRPRQVLCDKCKGVVASGSHREARRGVVELKAEEASRRRRPPDVPMSSELKRLKIDDRSGRSAADKRTSGTQVTSSSRRVLRGVVPSSSSADSSSRMRLKLNSKKVLTKSSDRPTTRKVLQKLAPHHRPKDQNQDHRKAVTRAAALQNHNQKVHFTRRLQHLSGTNISTPLPPRMRLKPQRYRTDEPAPCSASEASPKPATSPVHTPASPATGPPTAPPPPCAAPTVVERNEDEGAGWQEVEPPPPSSSSYSLDSSHSECSSTETYDVPPPGEPASSSSGPAPAPPPSSTTAVPCCPASSSPAPPAAEGEDEEDGGDIKRRRKLSTSSSSSSSSSSSVFSKSVSKCLLPDGRTVCVGDIVWAKIYGFPWWPARVLGITVARRGDTGLAVRQEARVSWFGSPTTSFLPLSQLSPFLETFQSRFDKKRKGPYRRAIAEAASAAKQLTPEVRALLTQFET
ncbi:PWWP domain-containing protein 2A [Cyprinodon tularosa]|uniref:PWWP domain-containing protein 2A n=1 Tax=Cyprinodon tularosa TaxID=77115 RepID=UPI0018E22D61|nr:PWWP domain-containing protein 2A [Cyprinodon tularosa]